MMMRRLTRLTSAFSKKWDNLWAACCLHFAFYNFCRDSLETTRYARDGSLDHGEGMRHGRSTVSLEDSRWVRPLASPATFESIRSYP